MAIVEAPVRVQSGSEQLEAMARDVGLRHSVPEHEVLVRLLLHLPRVATEAGIVEPPLAAAEADRLAARLSERTEPYAEWQLAPGRAIAAPDLTLETVADAVARVVLERFHYLESFRPGSEHFGGVLNRDRVAALLTVSPLDVPTIAEDLPDDVAPTDVAVLSRVFTFDWAPANTISFLLARLVRALRTRPRAPRLLLTYLNPNVGFTGASYRAANWSLWAQERGTRYAYLDGDYATDRALAARFGTAEPDELVEMLGERVTFSRMALEPLRLYAFPIDPRLRADLTASQPIDLPRPTA